MRPTQLDQQILHSAQLADGELQGHFIRDCLWSVFGTNLLQSDLRGTNASSVHHSQLIDRLTHSFQRVGKQDWPTHNPATIRRLGHQFESCWHAMLDQCDHPYFSNIPIRSDKKQTLGELDLVVNSPNDPKHWWHIEFAVKFYLGYQFSAAENLWIGPNQRDHLVDKLHHMRHQQLPLVRNAAAAPALQACHPELQPESIETSLAVMRGCLFHPANPDHGGQPKLPAEINPNCWQGLWTTVNDAPHFLPDGHWTVLPKYRWLSPTITDQAVERDALLDYLKSYFSHLTAPLCLVNLSKINHQLWREQQRWFVVPNNWTDTLKPHPTEF